MPHKHLHSTADCAAMTHTRKGGISVYVLIVRELFINIGGIWEIISMKGFSVLINSYGYVGPPKKIFILNSLGKTQGGHVLF